MPEQPVKRNLTRIVRTVEGYAGEAQDFLGWLKVTEYLPDEVTVNLSLIGLGYHEATNVIIEV